VRSYIISPETAKIKSSIAVLKRINIHFLSMFTYRCAWGYGISRCVLLNRDFAGLSTSRAAPFT
jgi:hypothetical protein